MKPRLLLLAAIAVGLLAPAAPAAAAVSYEVHYVPSVGGALIRVEVQRDTALDAPGTGRPADLLAVQHDGRAGSRPATATPTGSTRSGIARVVADVIGTRGSTGCWDYGGRSGAAVRRRRRELAGRAAVVQRQRRHDRRLLRRHHREHGRRARRRGAQGDRADRRDQPLVRLRLRERRALLRQLRRADRRGHRHAAAASTSASAAPSPPTRTASTSPTPCRPARPSAARSRTPQQGYSRKPDYTDVLAGARLPPPRRRLPRGDAGRPRVERLQRQAGGGPRLYEALPVDDPATAEVEGVPDKWLFMTQGTHGSPSGAEWNSAARRLPAHLPAGGRRRPPRCSPALPQVYDPRRRRRRRAPETPRAPESPGRCRHDRARPAPQPHVRAGRRRRHRPRTRHRRGRRARRREPLRGPLRPSVHLGRRRRSRGGQRARPAQRRRPRRAARRPRLLLAVLPDRAAGRGHPHRRLGGARRVLQHRQPGGGGTITPVLLDVAPGRHATTIQRGFINLDYAQGLDQARPAHRLAAGQRSSCCPRTTPSPRATASRCCCSRTNAVWAVPGNPQGPVNVATGPVDGVTERGTVLRLPLVDAPADLGG